MKANVKRAKQVRDGVTGALTQKTSPRLQASLRIKTILVAVDFSEFSKRSLAYAAGLADTLGARLSLLHVVESFPIDKFISPDTREADTSARVQGAEGELQTLSEAFADYRCMKGPHQVRVGKPYQEIVAAAKEVGADLIVMGSHGYTGLQRVYIGSTAERVTRYAPCHVLVVRE